MRIGYSALKRKETVMKMRRTLVLTAVLVALLSIGLAVPVSGIVPLPEPCIELEKTGPETATPGETITYHFTATNCGDVDLEMFTFYEYQETSFVPLWSAGPLLKNGGQAAWTMDFDVPPDKCDDIYNKAKVGACIDDTCAYDIDDWTVDVICDPPKCETELIAGKKYTAGVVEVWDDGTSLHLQYVADDWTIIDTQLYMSSTVPLKAAPGKFPYKGLLEYSVPLSEFDGNDVYIAAHAVVVSPSGKEETAWPIVTAL
jgi:hypothetical protein